MEEHCTECVLKISDLYYCAMCMYPPTNAAAVEKHVKQKHIKLDPTEDSKPSKRQKSDSDASFDEDDDTDDDYASGNASGDETEGGEESNEDETKIKMLVQPLKRNRVHKVERNFQQCSDRIFLGNYAALLNIYQGNFFKPSVDWTRDL